MSGARPLSPRIAELFAQGDEHIAALRESYTKRDCALAAAFVAVTQRPFPEVSKEVWQGCSCAFGPRCESNRCCEDSDQSIGLKDRRTGAVRRRAEYSMFHPFSRGPVPRLRFYCSDCFAEIKEAWGKPVRGLHPPKGASDFWQPSLLGMVQLAGMEINRQKRAQQAPPVYAPGDQPLTRREREMTPECWKQMLFIRQKLREFAARSRVPG